MRLTPLDIQSHHFARSLRGYSPEEVDAFLRMVAEDLEGVIRDADVQPTSMGNHLARLRNRV